MSITVDLPMKKNNSYASQYRLQHSLSNQYEIMIFFQSKQYLVTGVDSSTTADDVICAIVCHKANNSIQQNLKNGMNDRSIQTSLHHSVKLCQPYALWSCIVESDRQMFLPIGRYDPILQVYRELLSKASRGHARLEILPIMKDTSPPPNLDVACERKVILATISSNSRCLEEINNKISKVDEAISTSEKHLYSFMCSKSYEDFMCIYAKLIRVNTDLESQYIQIDSLKADIVHEKNLVDSSKFTSSSTDTLTPIARRSPVPSPRRSKSPNVAVTTSLPPHTVPKLVPTPPVRSRSSPSPLARSRRAASPQIPSQYADEDLYPSPITRKMSIQQPIHSRCTGVSNNSMFRSNSNYNILSAHPAIIFNDQSTNIYGSIYDVESTINKAIDYRESLFKVSCSTGNNYELLFDSTTSKNIYDDALDSQSNSFERSILNFSLPRLEISDADSDTGVESLISGKDDLSSPQELETLV